MNSRTEELIWWVFGMHSMTPIEIGQRTGESGPTVCDSRPRTTTHDPRFSAHVYNR